MLGCCIPSIRICEQLSVPDFQIVGWLDPRDPEIQLEFHCKRSLDSFTFVRCLSVIRIQKMRTRL
jgi:hypothetical protein